MLVDVAAGLSVGGGEQLLPAELEQVGLNNVLQVAPAVVVLAAHVLVVAASPCGVDDHGERR